MSSINIGIRHDNDFMIPCLFNIELFTNSCSERRNNRANFNIVKDADPNVLFLHLEFYLAVAK